MKLGEAIKNKDYSLFKKSDSSFYNYYDTLSEILYPDGYRLEWEHHEAVEKSGRVECYAVREWVCTDTTVGLYLYLIDREAVCLMYQDGRKSYPEWNFLSREALQKTRDLFDEYKPKNEFEFDEVDPDLLELHLDESLFSSQINSVQVGLSPVMDFEFVLTYKLKKEYLEKHQVDVFNDVLKHHDDILKYLKVKGDQVAIDRFLKDSQVIYDTLKELVS